MQVESSSVDQIEANVAAAIAEQMGYNTDTDGKPEVESEGSSFVYKREKLEFDDEFQTKIAAHLIRDNVFATRVDGLLEPDQFENYGIATLVNIAMDYIKTYRTSPSMEVFTRLVKQRKNAGRIREDHWPEVKSAFEKVCRTKIADTDYLIDQVDEFSRHKAVEQALEQSIYLMEKRDFGKIEQIMQAAMQVGASKLDNGYNYWERIKERTIERKEKASGLNPPTGITSGIKALDNVLYHKGWGRSELTVFMGAPKAGKSTALGEFAMNACLAGFNVLYVSLEVADRIISERLDARVADIAVSELESNINAVEERVSRTGSKAGQFYIHQFPPDTFSPRDLNRLIDNYKAKGVIFDLVSCDYGDIMAPDYRTHDTIKDSKSVYLGLRAIAMKHNLAMLTATQTNRDGAKSGTATMADVAEDFNKVRIADLLISINKTEQEKADNEARLFFAASRNQRGDFTIKIRQNLECMKFLVDIIDIH